jgi:hypothetical protein
MKGNSTCSSSPCGRSSPWRRVRRARAMCVSSVWRAPWTFRDRAGVVEQRGHGGAHVRVMPGHDVGDEDRDVPRTQNAARPPPASRRTTSISRSRAPSSTAGVAASLFDGAAAVAAVVQAVALEHGGGPVIGGDDLPDRRRGVAVMNQASTRRLSPGPKTSYDGRHAIRGRVAPDHYPSSAGCRRPTARRSRKSRVCRSLPRGTRSSSRSRRPTPSTRIVAGG